MQTPLESANMHCAFLAETCDELTAEVGRLRAALEPFAEPHPMGDAYVKFSPELIEGARTALKKG
jgi:hypothetical protein